MVGRGSRDEPLKALVSGAAAAGGLLAAGAIFAGAVTATVARRVVTPPRRRPEDTAVLAVDVEHGHIRFGASDDAALDGVYSFWFDGGRGHARVGRILERHAGSVVRELLGVDAGDIASATQGRFNGWVHLTPEGLGLPYESVRVQTTVGAAPAWIVPAERPGGRWAVLVHGRATVRQEVLRAVPVFHQAGYSCLLVSYRNDGEAPPSADNRYALGDTEWLDIESAILLALDRGAEEVVLMGWSMGGAIVLQTVTRSAVASVVTGVVLESPVVDWAETLEYQGDALRLPAPLQRTIRSVLSSRWGGVVTGKDEPIDFDRLDFVARSGELPVPILILHSDDDGFVPSDASHRLAEARPDIVSLVPFAVARHTRLWNHDPERWEGAIRAWLAGDARRVVALAHGRSPRPWARDRAPRRRVAAAQRGGNAQRA